MKEMPKETERDRKLREKREYHEALFIKQDYYNKKEKIRINKLSPVERIRRYNDNTL